MPYFHISTGLRGCYMPDQSFVIRADTRQMLKTIVEGECEASLEAYGFGDSKAERARVMAAVWRETRKNARKSVYPYAIGFGRSRAKSDRPFGVFIGHATRAEYVGFLENEGGF